MKKFVFILLLQFVCVSLFAQNEDALDRRTDKRQFGHYTPTAYFMTHLYSARKNNNPKTQYIVGWCYDYGKATLCTRSCIITKAQGELFPKCSIHGYGDKAIIQNYEEAYYWYVKAANGGNSDAMNKLGELYRNGKGVEQDDSQSFYWYKKAAEGGNDNAQYYLGECYEEGKGVAQSSTEAFNWYLTAAKRNADAQYKVGVCYDEGIGVAQNSSKAKKYWKKAAKDGNYFAQKALDEHKKK